MRTIFPRPQWIREVNGASFVLRPGTPILATEDCHDEAIKLRDWLNQEYSLGLTVERFSGSKSGIIVSKLDNKSIQRILESQQTPIDGREVVSEGYTVHVSGDHVLIAGFDDAGVFYGIQLLRQLITRHDRKITVAAVEVHDWPFKKMRGIHLYMPGREDLPFFRRLLGLLAALRYNTVFIEVGGGMRYDRHPEINEAWEQFVRTANAFDEGPQGLQRSQPFPKDSTHTELGGGSYLEKDEVREIIAYANSLHIEVLPEVPSLSHAYYLVCPHPELAERDDDPYPDTYCPSNPASYELLFDVMEEVIEVFRPRIIHIGHDEVYSYGLCPRCKGKSGAELIAHEINTVHDFLAEKGIRTAMWGDKLMNIIVGGRNQGGRERRVRGGGWFKNQDEYVMVETYQAVNSVPKDILILDWYWLSDSGSEQYFADYGFEEIFGNFGQNFGPAEFRNWDRRASAEHVLGAEVSTWCAVSEYALARNACIFNFLFSAGMMWWCHYADYERPRVLETIVELQPRVRDWLGDRKSPSLSGSANMVPLPLGNAAQTTLSFAGLLPDGTFDAGEVPFWVDGAETKGIRVDATEPLAGPIELHTAASSLVFLHTCQCSRKFRPTWAFSDPLRPSPEDLLGGYTIRFADGTETVAEIRFGENIANRSKQYGEDIAAVPYWAEPVAIGTDEEGLPVTLYRFEWINPHPEKTLETANLHFDESEGEVTLVALTRVGG
ncbi:MAG: family 20 glycosylhydrolase [Anaerolineae bacterium]|nr:family 20 glycosylhydrolase [Anaerolineae bacterium]